MKKILRAITVRLQESASNIHKIRFFFSIRVLGDMVWMTVPESPNIQLWRLKCLGFIAKISLAGPMSLTGYTCRYSLRWCRRNLCTQWHMSDTSSSTVIVKVLVTGNELSVVVRQWRTSTTLVQSIGWTVWLVSLLGKFTRKSYVVKIPTFSSKRGDVTKSVLTACKCDKLYC